MNIFKDMTLRVLIMGLPAIAVLVDYKDSLEGVLFYLVYFGCFIVSSFLISYYSSCKKKDFALNTEGVKE